MGRRKPNGYGCVTKLKGNRRRPWVVKVTIYDINGRAKQVPIDYAETEAAANIILAQYNNNPWNIERNKVTLIELYNRWAEIKLPLLGKSNQGSLKSAFKHCSKYYGVKYRSIRAYQMQDCIDSCGLSPSAQATIKSLWGHLDRFAFELDIIDKMYSQIATAPPPPETTRTPFTSEQVDALWALQGDMWADIALIYIYTGFRLNELLTLESSSVDTEEWLIRGGLKTAAGKGRVVPVHDRIKPLVQRFLDDGNIYFFTFGGKRITPETLRKNWANIMAKIGTSKTPHEARHTFETFLDNEHGNRKCIDMLMGHKSKDIGNRVYNHKTIEQLRETIALLK